MLSLLRAIPLARMYKAAVVPANLHVWTFSIGIEAADFDICGFKSAEDKENCEVKCVFGESVILEVDNDGES